MVAIMLGVLLSLLASAHATRSLVQRDIIQKGGWSLSVPQGASCPLTTTSCFTNQTGNFKTPSRGENCCPSQELVYDNEYGQQVQTPLLCGTYVNTGQPYACCPLGNADCRGDVGKTEETQKCSNSGWALWLIPDGGFNRFCCLPGQYGYWLPARGQDAVGQCSTSKTLPRGATPAQQVDNGDGSVSPDGTQLKPLPAATASPAPVCDVIANYGWSMQVDEASQCTAGSRMCDESAACCPNELVCGEIGPSQVQPCCPPENPNCRGDVNGLAVQVCADSAWSLWHVNTNGNHFCCLPGQVGYNVPNDQAATGFCGNVVPGGTMRSILDYPGDKSTPGSHLAFPCDTSPKPEYSLPAMISSIMAGPTAIAGAPGREVVGLGASESASALSGSQGAWSSTMETCAGRCVQTLTYVVQGSVVEGVSVTVASSMVMAASAQAVLVSEIMESAFSYTRTYDPLPSTVPETLPGGVFVEAAATDIVGVAAGAAAAEATAGAGAGAPGSTGPSGNSSLPVQDFVSAAGQGMKTLAWGSLGSVMMVISILSGYWLDM